MENTEKNSSHFGKLKKAGEIITNAAIVLIFILLCIAFFGKVTGKSNSVLGFHINVIVSGSMEPELKIGDIIVSRSYDGQALEIGDIVTYKAKYGDIAGSLVTHRIVDIKDGADGLIITTKGTAALVADNPISTDDIVSVMLFNAIPLKYCYRIITNPIGFLAIVILPLVAIIISEIRILWRQYKQDDKE